MTKTFILFQSCISVSSKPSKKFFFSLFFLLFFFNNVIKSNVKILPYIQLKITKLRINSIYN